MDVFLFIDHLSCRNQKHLLPDLQHKKMKIENINLNKTTTKKHILQIASGIRP